MAEVNDLAGLGSPEWDDIIARAVNKVEPRWYKHGNKEHDDLVQEARIGVWKAMQKLGPDLHEGQVYQAAYWAALGEVKKIYGLRKQEPPPLPLSLEALDENKHTEVSDPEDYVVCVLRRTDIELALSRLDEVDQTFIRKWLLEDHTAKEAAALADSTYSAVQTRWSKKIRSWLASELRAWQ